jgi:hypothetical protein
VCICVMWCGVVLLVWVSAVWCSIVWFSVVGLRLSVCSMRETCVIVWCGVV